MALPMPVNAPAEFAEWVATLGEHFDENQRVLLLGMHSGAAGAITLRFLAAAATGHVRVHQQISATYGAADHTEDIDCRGDRQQDVTLDIVDGQYVWLIPLWSDQGTLRAFDGATGPDHMAPIDLLGLDGPGSGLDADTLDGEEGLFYQDASNLISGVLADARVQASNVTQHQAALAIAGSQITGTVPDARLSSNVPLKNAANVFTGGFQTIHVTGGEPRLVLDRDVVGNRTLQYATNGSRRWQLIANASAEVGSNAGSDFNIQRFTDAAAFIDVPFAIARADGLVSIANGLSVGGGLMTVSSGGVVGMADTSFIGTDAGPGRFRIVSLGTGGQDGSIEWMRGGVRRWRWVHDGSGNIQLRGTDGSEFAAIHCALTTQHVTLAGALTVGGDINPQGNIDMNVAGRIYARGSTFAPGLNTEFDGVLALGAGARVYLAALQYSADNDINSLRVYTHPSGTGADPSVLTAEFRGAPVDGETALYLQYRAGGVTKFQKVTVDAVDSGGSGFRALRVPN